MSLLILMAYQILLYNHMLCSLNPTVPLIFSFDVANKKLIAAQQEVALINSDVCLAQNEKSRLDQLEGGRDSAVPGEVLEEGHVHHHGVLAHVEHAKMRRDEDRALRRLKHLGTRVTFCTVACQLHFHPYSIVPFVFLPLFLPLFLCRSALTTFSKSASCFLFKYRRNAR